MRKPSRRSLATLIRVRQELEKRLDAVVPWLSGPSSFAGIIEPDFARTVHAEASDSLRRSLAARTTTRFPLTHLEGRDVGELPARSDLSLSIAKAGRGEWSVFGNIVQVDARSFDWTAHPITGAQASPAHWTRVSYMDGVGGGDVKAIWELNRHHHLLRLAQGYYLTRDERLAESLALLIERWISQNPAGHGINWTSSLEVSFRAIAWCWIWALTCESSVWTRDRTGRFLVSLWHHARHIERFDSIHHSPNTHLTGEGLGLLYVGLLFPELKRARHWATLGREILDAELDAQVFDDGMHFERAVGYHRYTAEFYLHYLLLADSNGLPLSPGNRERIRLQIQAARVLRRPDGTWPVIGDEDSGDTLLLTTNDPQDQGPILALGGALFGDPTCVALTRDVHRAAGWWLLDDAAWRVLAPVSDRGVSTAGRSALVASQPWNGSGASAALTTAGYFIGSDRGNAGWWCLVDAGPHGGKLTGHAHTDLGHVEIAVGNTAIVADPGCLGYTMDPIARNWARSEDAHACLVIDGSPLAVPAGPFAWATVAPTPTFTHGDTGSVWWCELHYARAHERGNITHRRKVVLVRGHGVIVCDWIDGDAPPALAIHWPLADAPDGASLSEHGLTSTRYAVAWTATDARDSLVASLRPIDRSTGYARRQDARMLRLAHSGSLPTCIVSCFSATPGRFHVQLDDRGVVRVGLDAEREPALEASDEMSALVLSPGVAPALDRSQTRVPSHGAVR